jgi:hypothetical protein
MFWDNKFALVKPKNADFEEQQKHICNHRVTPGVSKNIGKYAVFLPSLLEAKMRAPQKALRRWSPTEEIGWSRTQEIRWSSTEETRWSPTEEILHHSGALARLAPFVRLDMGPGNQSSKSPRSPIGMGSQRALDHAI